MLDDLVEENVVRVVETENFENMTEQHYLELADQFKELMDVKIEDNKKYKRKMKEYQYICLKMFCIISMVNDLMNNMEFDELGNIGLTIKHNLEYCEEQLKFILKL
tara:strand:- start:13 stop:330 length:318 start_codon:yes stop_codon:yes gene_type:complete